MRAGLLSKLVGVAIFGSSAALVNASGTSLYLMPIADILGHREGFAYFGFSGNERNVDKGVYWFHAATVGLFDRIEVGYDNDFLGSTTYNVKLQIFDSPRGLPGTALSVGVANANGGYREPYVVGRYDFKGFRLHSGYWNTMGCGRLMVGTDFPVAKGTGALEYLSGPHGQTWASLYYPIDPIPGLGIVVAVGFPADRADGIQHSALLYYTFKL